MEEEDDDFYDPADAVPVTNTQNAPHHQSSNATPQHSNDDEEIEVEEDDDVRLANPILCLWSRD